MNREILFKAKTVVGDAWVEGLPHMDYDGDWCISNGIDTWAINRDTLCQYTGLTDKNGVKIWEGDVCRIMLRKKYGHERNGLSRPLGAVEYSRLAIREDSLYVFDTFNIRGKSIHYLLSMELEVIGNKFDNPELTKQS